MISVQHINFRGHKPSDHSTTQTHVLWGNQEATFSAYLSHTASKNVFGDNLLAQDGHITNTTPDV